MFYNQMLVLKSFSKLSKQLERNLVIQSSYITAVYEGHSINKVNFA